MLRVKFSPLLARLVSERCADWPPDDMITAAGTLMSMAAVRVLQSRGNWAGDVHREHSESGSDRMMKEVVGAAGWAAISAAAALAGSTDRLAETAEFTFNGERITMKEVEAGHE